MHCSLRNVFLNNAHDPLAVNTLITIIRYENALFIIRVNIISLVPSLLTWCAPLSIAAAAAQKR